jgi:hypothetical protein
MASWIQFIQQYGDGKNYALMDVEREDDGKLTIGLEDSTLEGSASGVITLRPEQVAQLKGFLNHD